MAVQVICEDGVRRSGPFPTRREADQWAWWGHCCTSSHTFVEVVTQMDVESRMAAHDIVN